MLFPFERVRSSGHFFQNVDALADRIAAAWLMTNSLLKDFVSTMEPVAGVQHALNRLIVFAPQLDFEESAGVCVVWAVGFLGGEVHAPRGRRGAILASR
jgi:hypothetical protein